MFREGDVRRDHGGRFAAQEGSRPDITLNRHFDDTWELEDGSSMLIENQRHPAFRKAWYRLPDGTPVGMIHWSDRKGEREVAVVCDIEVREEYRGSGHARRMIQEVEERIGRRLHTTGSFTPEGREALEALTPQHPWEPKPRYGFDSMTFVHDWDDLRTKH